MNRLNCKHKEFDIISKEETYTVKGETITIIARVKVCRTCKEELFDMRLDSENLKKAYDIYRKRHNIMMTEEIIALRKKYGLSQRDFANIIGCTQATVVRYEKGAIPNETYNNILKLLANPDNMKKALHDNIEKLESIDEKKVENALRQENFCKKSSIVNNSIDALMNKSADIFNGFKKFNLEKFKAMVVFFAENQTNLYKTKLMKLLWYSDMAYFREYGTSISGINYIHQYYGPIPVKSYTLLGWLEDNDYIEIEEQSNGGEIILAKNITSNMDCLSKNELKILSLVNDRFKNMTSQDISNISHKEQGYIKTEQKENISFEYALELKAI